ncbi:MAG: peptide deformylase [Bacteroidia bacterium]|nr:peptide deformylase [Bacteroidia bacterium]
MILPIVAYGSPVLTQRAEDITPDYPNLAQLIQDMYETMYNADGVGLAAPQVNLPIRLFVVDGSPIESSFPDEVMTGFKQVFINPEILEESGEPWAFEEGCLSIPDIRELVRRQPDIKISYLDENFLPHTEVFTGMKARVIQHEYDHLEGTLFTDHVSAMRRQILKPRLLRISQGQVDQTYPMKFTRKR